MRARTGITARWREGRLGPGLRHAVQQELRAGLLSLGRGEVEEARARVERAHQASQNAPLLHAAAHLGRAVVAGAESRPGLALAELRLSGMAVPASVIRRMAGLQPGQDNGPGLWPTWRDRHELRARVPEPLELLDPAAVPPGAGAPDSLAR